MYSSLSTLVPRTKELVTKSMYFFSLGGCDIHKKSYITISLILRLEALVLHSIFARLDCSFLYSRYMYRKYSFLFKLVAPFCKCSNLFLVACSFESRTTFKEWGTIVWDTTLIGPDDFSFYMKFSLSFGALKGFFLELLFSICLCVRLWNERIGFKREP